MEVHGNGKTDLVSLESGDDSGITISGPDEEEEDSRQNEDSADLKEVKTLDLNNSYPKTNYERVPSQNDGSKRVEGADSVEIRVQTQVSTSSGIDGDTHSALRDEELLRAATFVLDAKKGRNMDFKRGQKFVNAYLLYNKWYLVYTLYFVITVNLCLALFEKPAMQGWEAPYWATMIIELACLGFFIFRTAHAFYFTTKSRFWQDSKNIVVIVVILLTLIDMIGYIVWVNVGPAETAVRWSRVLRPMFIVNFPDGRQIRRSFRNIRRTLPEIANVLLLFFLSLLLFALLALKLFINKPELIYPNGRPYFKNYLDSMWDMYVLVTTANNPDVMMPAYDQSNWYALFFGVYLIICLYIFMSIVLAVIYNNYKKNLKNEVKLSVYNKRRKLAEAFNVLKVEHKGSFVVTGPRFVELMKAVDPKKSHTCVDLLLKVLDANGDLSIGKNEFLTLADLLQLPVSEVKDRMTIIETYFPQVYNHRASRFLQLVVRHRFFRFFFDLMIFINAFFIGFSVDQADWFFLFIFTVEITLKLYTFGVKEFFSRFWNVFDFFVIGIALIASIVEAAMGADQEEFQTLDPLLVLRVMRLIKIFGSIPRFKVIILTIVNIGPPILSFGGVIFIIYYIFAIIGMEIYHGRIEYFEDIYNASAMLPNSSRFCGNMLLKNSDFFRFRYCSNNFNNLPKAFVLLFELTVVNQWHVLSSGFVLVTHKAARLYFFVFHVTTVVIVLNIFVAFILEAFILEYSLSRAGRLESAVESKIKEMGLGIGVKTDRIFKAKDDKIELVDNEQEVAQSDVTDAPHNDDSDNESLPDITRETGMRFHLKKKSRKKMEVLLQHMFEGEIDPEDEGFEDTQESRPRRLTLDVVS